MEPYGKSTTKAKMNIVDAEKSPRRENLRKNNKDFVMYLEARSSKETNFDLVEVPDLFLQNEAIMNNFTERTEILLQGEHGFQISAFHYIKLYARSAKIKPENARLNIHKRIEAPLGLIWVASVYHDHIQSL